MLQEITCIRQVLKYAEGMGWLPYVPNLSTAYMTQTKKGRRAWFSPEEYETLYEATRDRIANGTRRGWQTNYEELHDFVLIMANTGLRPDEAWKLEFRDVKIEEDYVTKETILVIGRSRQDRRRLLQEHANAVFPFQRLRTRRLKQLATKHGEDANLDTLLAKTKVFPKFNRELFNEILREKDLKFDRDGLRRTAYSLRHTYISMRLMEGANIYQIANNCRTSVQMIEEHYASHIKDRLDTATINVMRPETARKAAKQQAKEKGQSYEERKDARIAGSASSRLIITIWLAAFVLPSYKTGRDAAVAELVDRNGFRIRRGNSWGFQVPPAAPLNAEA